MMNRLLCPLVGCWGERPQDRSLSLSSARPRAHELSHVQTRLKWKIVLGAVPSCRQYKWHFGLASPDQSQDWRCLIQKWMSDNLVNSRHSKNKMFWCTNWNFNLKPMYSFCKWWKWKISHMGFVYLELHEFYKPCESFCLEPSIFWENCIKL